MTENQLIDVNKVSQVYSGKDRHCRCGRGGIYRIPSRNRDRGKQIRGYDFEDADVSDSFVRKVVSIINKAYISNPESITIDKEYINYSYGKNRAYTAYL